MEKRSARVSETQWSMLIEFLESNPNLARARGYNNSAQGRAESLRLWQQVATLLNAEGSGTSKTPKEWSIYVSNYKSKLKKIVADINTDATATGGGPPRASTLSDLDSRFLALLGPGFGQTAPRVMVQPFPDEQPSTLVTTTESEINMLQVEDIAQHEAVLDIIDPLALDVTLGQNQGEASARATTPRPTPSNEPLLPRLSRQRRQCTRPLAPLDEARRILSQVEMQRAAADAANARATEQMAQNLLPLRDIACQLGRFADIAEQYVQYIISRTTP